MTSPRAFAYRLELPADGQRFLTANQRLFWRVRNDRTKYWRTLTAARARQARIPKLPHAWIVAELRFSEQRRRDPANWAPTAKACVDGLVDAGVLADDDHTHVTGPDMRLGVKVPPAERGIYLLIFPAPPLPAWEAYT